MNAVDIAFWLGMTGGCIVGAFLGYGRGQLAGIRWCIKRLDEPNPASEIDGMENIRRVVSSPSERDNGS